MPPLPTFIEGGSRGPGSHACLAASPSRSRVPPNGAPPIIHSGTAAQKRRWLPGLFTWDTSFCLAITEATAGSDVSAICTSAVRTPDWTAHIVNGMKKRVMSPYASGISIHRIHNTGHTASDSLWVELTDVKVPIENQIGPENGGSPLVLRNFNKERFILAVGCNRQA